MSNRVFTSYEDLKEIFHAPNQGQLPIKVEGKWYNVDVVTGKVWHLNEVEVHGLDTQERVCFYEQDFYVLSNFSAFTLMWKHLRFDTLEHAYHWEKFNYDNGHSAERFKIRTDIVNAISAHEAFKIAARNKEYYNPRWETIRVAVMKELLLAKVEQHEYVKRKLLATGHRELVENSWRDNFWGWGLNKDGENQLGKLWMEIRDEIRAKG